MKGGRRDRYFTVMLVPEGRQGVYRWVLSAGLLKTMIVLSVIIITALGCSLGTVYYMQKRIAELHYIEKQNSLQAKKIYQLEQQAQLLQEKFEEIEKLDSQVREMVGLGKGGGQRTSEASRSGHLLRLHDKERTLNWVQSVLAKVEGDFPEKEQQLKTLARDIKEHLDYQAALPDLWPTAGPISSYFGYRASPFGWGREYHDGIDIAANYGSEVKAAGRGYVTFAGYMPVYGRTVIIDHGYGLTSFYGHNSRLLVKAGDRVEKGQVICRVGNSGRSTGSHLHFGIKVNGKPVDPLKYLKGE